MSCMYVMYVCMCSSRAVNYSRRQGGGVMFMSIRSFKFNMSAAYWAQLLLHLLCPAQ